MKKQIVFVITCLVGFAGTHAKAGDLVEFWNKFEAVHKGILGVKTEVLSDPLFACRNSDNDTLTSCVEERYSSYTLAIEHLFGLYKKVRNAFEEFSLIEDMEDDLEVDNNQICQVQDQIDTMGYDVDELVMMARDLQKLASRLIQTKQWAQEMGYDPKAVISRISYEQWLEEIGYEGPHYSSPDPEDAATWARLILPGDDSASCSL